MEDALRRSLALLAALTLAGAAAAAAVTSAQAAAPTYDITTLAGKVASLHGTAGLQIRFSAFIEEEAEEDSAPPAATPISPPFVLNSPLDGTSVQPPNVTVNQDTAGAPQNETAIAVDPNNPQVIVAGANDYVSRTWSCTIAGTPCSALGDGYSGTYLSTDGGSTWCCTATDPNHLGTLIPGVERLTGGQYDAGGDPSVAFDSRGTVYYAGLGFNRTSAPNTVAVNRGTINNGSLTWSAPTFINQTTSPAILNDKEWIAVDHNPASPFRDRVYVTWTRFKFQAQTGAYVQSPIAFVSSSDGGRTFTTPKMISGSAHYGQGSRPVVGPDGSLYVFWDGSTRLATTDSTYVVKSTDGGATWSAPKAIAPLVDIAPLHNTAFRVNSYPAAAVAANGDVYATWDTETSAGSVAVYSKSTDGGNTWSAPARVFAAATRTPDGYPVTQPSGGTLNAPSPLGAVEDVFPAAATGPNGRVYLSAYRGDVVSPWQTCASGPPAPVGRIECDTLGDYVHNTRLDYVVTDLTTNVTQTVSTHPINTQNGFGGGFFGDYTDIAVGSDGNFHAFWTDSNNKQNVVWFYGAEFVPTSINQEDVVSASGAF
jgi:BNR repeat-like domain